jgi:hypothetical protein
MKNTELLEMGGIEENGFKFKVFGLHPRLIGNGDIKRLCFHIKVSSFEHGVSVHYKSPQNPRIGYLQKGNFTIFPGKSLVTFCVLTTLRTAARSTHPIISKEFQKIFLEELFYVREHYNPTTLVIDAHKARYEEFKREDFFLFRKLKQEAPYTSSNGSNMILLVFDVDELLEDVKPTLPILDKLW